MNKGQGAQTTPLGGAGARPYTEWERLCQEAVECVVYSSATVPTHRQHTPARGLREPTERTLEVLMSAPHKGRSPLEYPGLALVLCLK